MSTNQRQDNKSLLLSTIGKCLYLNAEKADVHFIFESGDERVPAQKCILSGGSDIFDAMFFGPLKEDGDIKIVDSTAETFKEFLRFFYFTKVDVSMKHVADVMYLGNKYNVKECVRLCVNVLTVNITVQTVICTLSLAIFHDQKQLQNSCDSFIASKSDEVLKSETFLSCNCQVLEHILKMDCLSCTETTLFEACMSWVRAISGIDDLTRDLVQTHLGKLFYEIRFAAMGLQEFGKLLPAYGHLFSASEYNEIFQVFSRQTDKPNIFKMTRRLNTKLILCDRVTDYGKLYSFKREEITTFSSNTELLLVHFVIAPMFKDGMIGIECIDDVSITITADSTELMQFTRTLVYSSDDNGYRVDLDTPTSINPDATYQIRIMFATDEARLSRMYFKSTIHVQNDIFLHFSDDRVVNDRIVGTVRFLGFNLLNTDAD